MSRVRQGKVRQRLQPINNANNLLGLYSGEASTSHRHDELLGLSAWQGDQCLGASRMYKLLEGQVCKNLQVFAARKWSRRGA